MRVVMLIAAAALAGCGQSEQAPRLDQASGDWYCDSGDAFQVFSMEVSRMESIEWRNGVTIIEAERRPNGSQSRFYIWPMGYCIQAITHSVPPTSRG